MAASASKRVCRSAPTSTPAPTCCWWTRGTRAARATRARSRPFARAGRRWGVFDYGYRRFHDDGFGKSPRSLVTRDSHAQDMVLAAALVAFWRQVRYFNGDVARAQRYRLAAPLAG